MFSGVFLWTNMARIAVEEAKEAALISTIKRQEKLKAWGDYIGFGVTKGSGVVALVSGVVSLAVPNLLPVHLQLGQSEAAIGIGLALLTGNKIVRVVAKLVSALKQ
jgi:hypothetical protein